MAEFTPITTQEEFDAAIGKRLERERKTISDQYGDYETLKSKVADYEKQIGDLTASRDALQTQVKGYETNSVKMRIAHEIGIPFELAGRLSGETEEEIRKDATAIARFVSKGKYIGPLKSDGPDGESTERASMRQMLHSMKGVK